MAITYMFIAGDPSGDHHASSVIKHLQSIDPSCRCIGIGGPAMRMAGFTALLPFEPFNRMGFIEVIIHLPFFLSAQKKCIRTMRTCRPDCLICVDYSGFNIPMMKAAYKMGIPVVWYIAPMVWAWKKKRAAVLARYAKHICCIFPFEVAFFLPFTQNVSFVGNPLAESLPAENPVHLRKTTLPENPVLAILPGSRFQEVSRILPHMVGAYKILKEKHPLLKAVVSRYVTIPEETYGRELNGTDIEMYSGPLWGLLLKADIALVTSGTATLETAIMGVPQVIVYKTSPITYALFKHYMTISHIGLPNILAGETIAPECIQQYVNDKELSEQVGRYLTDAEFYRTTVEKHFRIKELLGPLKPSHEVAGIIRRCSRLSV